MVRVAGGGTAYGRRGAVAAAVINRQHLEGYVPLKKAADGFDIAFDDRFQPIGGHDHAQRAGSA